MVIAKLLLKRTLLVGLSSFLVHPVTYKALFAWARRTTAIILILAVVAPLNATQAALASEEAGKAVDSAIARLKSLFDSDRLLIRTKAPLQEFDPTQAAQQVNRIRLCPRNLSLYAGENFNLTPVGIDRNGNPVQGVVFEWSAAATAIASVSSTGEVTGIAAGRTQVQVSCGPGKALVNVEVLPGSRPIVSDGLKSDEDWQIEHAHDCDDPESDPGPRTSGANTQPTPTRFEPRSSFASDELVRPSDGVQTPHSNTSFKDLIGRARFLPMLTQITAVASRLTRAALSRTTNAGTSESLPSSEPATEGPSAVTPQVGGILDGGSPDTTSSASIAPYNAVGSPRFSPMEESGGSGVKSRRNLGSYNYSFAAPVLAMSGRGIGASLALIYNSRVWNKEAATLSNPDGAMTFNFQKGWPAPGWTLGYGRVIENYDGLGNWLLIQPDGTRIHLQIQPNGDALSSDGSMIAFNPTNKKLHYTDGTMVDFDSWNNRWLPTVVRSSNGDQITLSYKTYQNDPGLPNYFPVRWAIDTITDTLGRLITFNYDSAGRLTSITAKKQGGMGDRVLCQIDYTDITLQYNFKSTMPVSAPTSGSVITVVRRIYYPNTGRGYVMTDYSSYGMARRVSMRIGMTPSGDGTEVAYTRYDYIDISTQQGFLNDSPQFSHRFEWWQNKIDGAAETAYGYSRANTTDPSGNQVEEDTVDYPNGMSVVTTSGNDQAGNPDDFGHVVKTVYNPASPTFKRTIVQTYAAASGGGVLLASSAATDEASNTATTTYEYDPVNFNRLLNVNEFGFTGAVQRRTNYTYSDDAGLIAQNIIYAVTRVRVFNASNQLVARADYEIDNYTFNPLVAYAVQAPNHDWNNYGSTGTFRGNITAVTSYITPAGPTITRHIKYDVYGNVVEAEVNCCQVKTTTFDESNWFSQPISTTDGRPDISPFLTTQYSYDLSTGLLLSTTDPNGNQTTFDYDSAWRLLTVHSPTGATVTTRFDQDAQNNDLLSYVQTTSYDDSGPKVITSRSWFDGAGRVIRAGTAAGANPTSYDAVKAEYDNMGRVNRQFNPYTGDANGNGSPSYWTANTYDLLSRVTSVTLPDGQSIQTSYNGSQTTVTDQVGRKRQSQVDGLGRLISVTEQDPQTQFGDLSWTTNYTYDTLDNLTGVNQGGQTRSFTYDSISRPTSQNTPEGGPVSFTYTDFGAVQKRTDARGVEAHYSYDSLNRLSKVWYTGSGGSDDPNGNRPPLPSTVAPTSQVDITYNSTAPGNGAVASIVDGQGLTGFSTSEMYQYDSFGRLISKTRTIDGVGYQTQYQYNQASQATLMIYPSGKRVRMNYDSRGRLAGEAKVNSSGNVLTTYLSNIGYNVAGQITGMSLGNGVNESYTYSPDRLQLTRQQATIGATKLMDLNYSYAAAANQSGANTSPGNSGQLMGIVNNPEGQPSTINTLSRNQSFTYDNVGRLVTATGTGSTLGAWQRRFAYDRWGNRTGVWDSTSAGTQIQSITLRQQIPGVPNNQMQTVTQSGSSLTQTYDASGNLTNDGVHTYQYDAAGRLAKLDVGSANESSYLYDANNWRVKKVAGAGTVTTNYIWEGALVIAEYSNDTAGSGGTSLCLADRLSTRMITDANGAFKGTQDHLPFGQEGGTTGTTEKHRFTSYERDFESGTDYAIHREHASNAGRFMQPDPIAGDAEQPQSLNLYSYVANDPLNFIDSLGLKKICVPSQVPGDEGCVFCWDDKDDKGQVWKDCSAQFSNSWGNFSYFPSFAPFAGDAGGGFGGFEREPRETPPVACPLDPKSLRVPNGRPPEPPWSRLNPPERLSPPESLSPPGPQLPSPPRGTPVTGTPLDPKLYPRVSPTEPMVPQNPSPGWWVRFTLGQALRGFASVFKGAVRSVGEGFGFIIVDPCLVDRRYCGCGRVSGNTMY